MSPLNRAKALSLLAGAVVIVVACGPAGSATATPGATSAAVATQVPVTEAPASTDGGLPTFALPSFVGDQELEDMLPDQIAGEDLTVLSMTGPEFLSSGGGTELQAMLTSLGKQPSDLSVAFGGTMNVSIVAFRVKGVPAGQLLPALIGAYQQEIDASPTQVSFGGKSVTKFTPTDASEGVTYIYPAGDTVFAVIGMGSATDAMLNEVFSKLP
jgi:hypothetical protein